ncbi:dihydrolipoamide acetyltransferase family protein [Salinicoccus sp. Marseille-QA3877]
MAEKIVMPKLGATMEEGIIDTWLVEVGGEVEEGDPIVEIQTDKITMEVEAEISGFLLKKLYGEGDSVPVQEVIAFVGEQNENLEEYTSINQENDVADLNTKASSTSEVEEVQSEKPELKEHEPNKVRRTPQARRIAKENNISLAEIKGTGPFGRIQKVDVEKYLAKHSKLITPLAKSIAEDKQIELTNIEGSGTNGKIVEKDLSHINEENLNANKEERVAFKGMRKVIANRISESFYSAPHVTLYSDIDMTEVVKLREQLLPLIEEKNGVRLSYNEIMIKASAYALKNNPEINISLENEKEIVYHSNINIGMAVAVPNGLVVPVLKNVDEKGLGSLVQESKSYAEKARGGQLLPEDMQGSTFSISNLGMFSVDGFTPIINQPNAAILGVGQIQDKPVAVNNELNIRSIMTLSLSFDHRVIDGAPAAKFLTDLKNLLEQPNQLLV